MLSKTEIWFENAPMGQRVRLVELPHETGGRRVPRVARLSGYLAAYPEYGILTDRGLFPPNAAVVFETGRRTAPHGSPQRTV